MAQFLFNSQIAAFSRDIKFISLFSFGVFVLLMFRRCFANHFLDSGYAGKYFFQARFPERNHAGLHRLVAEFFRGTALVDHFTQLIVHGQPLEQTRPAFETGVVACGTAAPAIKFLIDNLLGRKPQLGQRFGAGSGHVAAILAYLSHQTLGQYRFERRGEQKRRQAHVAQTRDRAGRVVGVQGTEHHVAGERCLYGDFRRLEIADFTDQDFVGILPQYRPQALRESVADRRVDGHLNDAVDVVLDRIFGGNQLVFYQIQFVQSAV